MDKSQLSPNQLTSPEIRELMNNRELVIAHAKYGAYHTLLNTNHEFAKRMLAPQAAVVVSETVQSELTPEVTATDPREIHATVVYDMEKERRIHSAREFTNDVLSGGQLSDNAMDRQTTQQEISNDQLDLAA